MVQDGDPPPTIGDCWPGDLVVILEHDDEVWVELGARMGVSTKAKKDRPSFCLVTTIDRDTLSPMWSTWRAISADAPVVSMIATKVWLRSLQGAAAVDRASMDVADSDPLRGNAGKGF